MDCDGNKYAIKLLKRVNKIYDADKLKLLIAEANTLKILKHPQICMMYEFNEHGKILVNDPYKEIDVMYMALELVPNSELFAYVYIKKGFSDEICRLYFLELVEIIEYMHSKSICHRDLKLENIMLDKSYHLKLLDFGFSKIIPYHSKTSTLLKSFQGSKMYMAPEILEKKPYDGKLVDVFALGVILYALRTGEIPFQEATIYDKKYYQLILGKPTYWEHLPHISNDFRSLIFHMLDYNPSTRYRLANILSHPWCKGPTATEPERIDLFTRIHAAIEEKERINSLLTINTNSIETGIYREDGEPALEKGLIQEWMLAPPKLLFTYDACWSNDIICFKTTIHPNVVMHVFEIAINELNPSSIECDDKYYQITLNMKLTNTDLEIQIQICKIKEKLYYVDIQRIQVHS